MPAPPPYAQGAVQAPGMLGLRWALRWWSRNVTSWVLQSKECHDQLGWGSQSKVARATECSRVEFIVASVVQGRGWGPSHAQGGRVLPPFAIMIYPETPLCLSDLGTVVEQSWLLSLWGFPSHGLCFLPWDHVSIRDLLEKYQIYPRVCTPRFFLPRKLLRSC